MTSWPGLVLARARASWGLLVTLLSLVLVTTAIIAGTLGYSQAAASTAAQDALTQGEPTESGVQVQTRLAPDPQRQDELAREVITGAFAPAPVSIGRLVVSEPRPVQDGRSPLEGDVVLTGGPDLAPGATAPTGLVSVVEGTWPTASTTTADTATAATSGNPAPGALHVGAAQAWGVEVGDVLTLDTGADAAVAIEVTATWQPVDAQDAFWFGDELVRTGVLEDGDLGPLVVDETLVSQVGDPFVRWPVRPDASQVTPDDLGVLAAAAQTLRSELRDVEGLTVRGVQVEGDLAPTAGQAATNLATARALGVVPLSVLVLVTGLAVTQLARLLSTTREAQAELLVARGATRAQVLLSGLGESVAVALVGATLGTLGAWSLLQAVPGSEGVGARVLSAGALTLLGIVLALAAVSALQVRRLSARTALALASGRARAATALATVALVLAAAALSWWQLRRAGSPLTRQPDGTLGTDLVAGAAPALLLAAAAVVAAALLGPLARVAEVGTRPSRRVGAHLASAQVSRRVQVYAVPVVLTVLAVGSTTLAGLYAGTSAQLRDDLADVSEGAPLRADLVRPPATTTPGLVPAPPPDLSELSGIGRSVLVWAEPDARVGDVAVPLTLADTDALTAVATVPAGQPQGLVPAGLGQVRTADGEPVAQEAVGIPAGTRELTVDLAVERSVDRWEVARLEGLAETEREREEALVAAYAELDEEPPEGLLPAGSLEERVRQQLDAEVEAAAAPAEVTVTLTLQETTTGLTSAVAGEPVSVDGPRLDYDRDTLSEVTATPASTEGTVTFELPERGEFALLAMTVDPPPAPTETPSDGAFLPPTATLTLDLALRADGADLLDRATGWGSPEAATPEAAAPLEAEAAAVQDPVLRAVVETDPSFVGDRGPNLAFDLETNAVAVPPSLDTGGATWRVELPNAFGVEEVLIGPGLGYQGVIPGLAPGAGPDADPGTDGSTGTDPAGTVPVALSTQAATAAALEVGDPMTVSVVGTTVPARVAAVVPGLPGQQGPTAALADAGAVSQVLAQQQRSLTWPTQVWARPAPSATVAGALEALQGREDLRAVVGPGTVSVTDATSAARLVFWVASAGAVLLALTGVAAVAATLLSARRAEVAVLRALGMPPAGQARSRALELAGVVAAAVLFGLAAGWAVGQGVVPELAASTTQPGRLQLPAALRLEVGTWAVLLVAVALGLAATALAVGGRVRTQALDRDYREEIR